MSISAESTPVACARCGTFAPLATSWGRSICEACFGRALPTKRFAQARFLCGRSLQLLGRIGLACLLLELALCTPFNAGSNLLGMHALGWVFELGNAVGSAVIEALAVHLALQWDRTGTQPSLRQAAAAVLPRAHVFIPAGVLLQGMSILGLILVGLYFWLVPLFFIAVPLAALERHGLFAAFGESRRRMRGLKLALALLLLPLVTIAIAAQLNAPEGFVRRWIDVGLGVVLAPVYYSLIAAVYLETLPWQQRR